MSRAFASTNFISMINDLSVLMKIVWKTEHIFIWDESELVSGGEGIFSCAELLHFESILHSPLMIIDGLGWKR